MGDRVTLASLGKVRWFCDEVNAGRGVLLGVLLQDGLEADDTLIDRLTLAEVFAVTANKEAAWQGGTPYQRKSYNQVTISTQPAQDRIDYDISDPTWTVAGDPATPQLLGKFGVCFAPTAGAQNTAIVPLAWMDYPVTAEGTDLEVTLAAQGFYRNAG